MTGSDTPREAATVALLRPGHSGPQVLLLGRPASASFAPLTEVFPGGSVDRADADPKWRSPQGLSAEATWDARASLRLRVAAIRETYEECGVLLARDAQGHGCSPQQLAELAPYRALMRAGEPGAFRPALERLGLALALDEIVFCAHWVTPEGLPRRFDTRFFLAELPRGQAPTPDPLGEHVSLRWALPATALAEGRRGECQLLPPTRALLEWLADATSVAEALRQGRAATVVTVRPRLDDVTADRYPGLDLSTLHRS